MKNIVFLIAGVFLLVGCDESNTIDTTPPAPPRRIVAVARDNAVELSWLKNTEPDVAGYNIWVSESYDGDYQKIGSTEDVSFIDYDAQNGIRSYYGVTAFDYEGNESGLSSDFVYATPRPEGFGIGLNDYRTYPSTAGYDFSTFSVGMYNDNFTDVFFEYYDGRFYLDVWDDTEIQDMGYTGSLHDIAVAPPEGWLPSRSVEAVVGHTYVIWTWDDHYAKIRVTEVTSHGLTFDWAYQTVKSDPELKRHATSDGERNRAKRVLQSSRN